jgi:hypothetical protein
MILSRPLLIIALGLFHIAWGIFVIIQNFFFVDVLTASSQEFRNQLFSIVAVTLSLNVLSIIAGVGIILGKRGGWAVSVFYFCYRFIESAYSLSQVVFTQYTPELRVQPTGDLRSYYLTRTVVFLCVLVVLLLQSHISSYFSLTPKYKIIVLGIASLCAAALFNLTEFFSHYF